MERFFAKTMPEPNSGCLLWLGGGNGTGYGVFHPRAGQQVLAHRFAWQLANGDLPAGMECRHICDTPPCVNVEHLRLGTHRQNMHDKYTRGRHIVGEVHANAKLTEEDVRRARGWLAQGASKASIARELCVSRVLVYRIENGKAWRHLR